MMGDRISLAADNRVQGFEQNPCCLQQSYPAESFASQQQSEILLLAQVQAEPVEVQRAYALLGRGFVNDAIAAFQQAIRRYPRSVPARLGLAIAYRRAGRLPDAWNAYQQVLAQDPNNRLALRTVGVLGGFSPQWQRGGIAALSRLLSLNPNDTEARAQRALLFTYQGRSAEALADYQIVLRTNATAEVVLGAAQAYANTGNYEQARALFNRYLGTGLPITGYAAIAYARSLRNTGNAAAAVQVLELQLQRSSQLDQEGIQTRLELSQAYLANQQPEAAFRVLEPLRGRATAALPLARSLNEVRRRTNAANLDLEVARLYRQAIAATPRPSASLLREVADVLSGIPSQQQFALQLYRQLSRQQPNDQGLFLQQLVLENRLGLLSRAELRQRLQRALQPLPTDPRQRQVLAGILVELDPPEPELLPAYQSLIAAGVNEPFLYFRVAQIALQRNDLVTARRALENYRATPAGAQDPQAALFLLADIERLSGNLEASARAYQTIINSPISDRNILNAALRGLLGIRLTQERADDALAVYDRLIALNPQDPNLELGRASLAFQTRRISQSQAEAILTRWLQQNPTTSPPPEVFSLAGALPPDPRREALYNQLLRVEPNNIPVQLRLIQVIAKRNPQEARERLSQLIARDPKNISAYFIQGQIAQDIDDLQLATNAYQNILALQPKNTDALSALGGVRFRQRRYDEAEELYNQVLTIKPRDITARRSLAGLAAVQDRPVTALEQLEEIQIELAAKGTPDSEVSRQIEQLQESFLRRRGFQPPWERYF